ncbi:hypothetical protein ACRAWG_00915 [Methylobacterium sp. P31]
MRLIFLFMAGGMRLGGKDPASFAIAICRSCLCTMSRNGLPCRLDVSRVGGVHAVCKLLLTPFRIFRALVHLFSTGMNIFVPAMEKAEGRRLVAITGVSADGIRNAIASQAGVVVGHPTPTMADAREQRPS